MPKAGDLEVDGDNDNSIMTNGFDPTDGVNCVAVKTSSLTTEATSSTVGNPIHDVAHLTTPANAGGTITFKAYKRTGANPDCSGTAAFTSSAVAVSGPADYSSGDFTPTSAGTYDWTASYTGDFAKAVLGTSGACGAANESSVVTKRSPAVTTDAGPTVVLANGSASLADAATLATAYNATGSITFKLYSDASCTVQVGSTKTSTVTGNGTYLSDAITVNAAGMYHWIANYSGDDNNNPTTNACNDSNENVRAIDPGIVISKGPERPDGRRGRHRHLLDHGHERRRRDSHGRARRRPARHRLLADGGADRGDPAAPGRPVAPGDWSATSAPRRAWPRRTRTRPPQPAPRRSAATSPTTTSRT